MYINLKKIKTNVTMHPVETINATFGLFRWIWKALNNDSGHNTLAQRL